MKGRPNLADDHKCIISLTLICSRIITTDCCCYNANVQTVRVLRSVPKNMILPSDLPLACPNAYTVFWTQWQKECSIGGVPRFEFFDKHSRASIYNILLLEFFASVFIGGNRWFVQTTPDWTKPRTFKVGIILDFVVYLLVTQNLEDPWFVCKNELIIKGHSPFELASDGIF